MPNKLSQFWQELKRRNVVRVITVYAGAAFVILELTDIITEPLKLPSWLLPVVIVLLSIGFIIAIILSWIYDIHPEEGMVKTEQANKVEQALVPKSSSSWKIASYISFVVIVGLIILNIIPRAGKEEVLDKSIAVLPFLNDSPDEEKMYFINGSMQAILDRLSSIRDLRVVSRTSVEQYRNNLKPISEIAREMNVSYILEGSGLKHGDQIRLTLYLIDAAHDTQIWSNSYTRKEDEVFELYSDVAQRVASEIETVITPEELELIDKIPTRSTTAFDLYQRAVEVGPILTMDSRDIALELLDFALDYDSTFALAYIRKGLAYIDMYSYFSDLNESYLDSVALMVERALHFDPKLAAGYSLEGHLFSLKGKTEEALNSYDRALQLNPNLAGAYRGKAAVYGGEEDYVNQLENYYQNILRDRTPANLSANYESIGFVLTSLGLGKSALKCYEKMLQYEGDSIWFHFRQSQVYFYTEDFPKAIDIALSAYEKISALDLERRPSYAVLLVIIGESYMYTGRVEESYRYLNLFFELGNTISWAFPWFKMSIAYSFTENRKNEKARELIELQIRQSEQWIQSNNKYSSDHYRYLALAYMLKQDEQKALAYLRLMIKWEGSTALLAMFPLNPIFRPLENNPEFIAITDQLRANFLEEQDQVRKWLEENDML